MKNFVFVFYSCITILLFFTLNQRISGVPPLGKFFDPLHGFWQNTENEALNIPPTHNLKGLKKPVRVYWDKQYIPHIFASNEYDMYYTQGYIAAFHRLWQMEFQIKKTAGRLSEILGKITLSLDREQRRKGMVYYAQKHLEHIEKDTSIMKIMQPFIDGVNEYISHLRYKNYPIEYKLLDYEPEKWDILKIALLQMEMSDQLSSGNRDLENTNLVQILGKEIFNFLFPEKYSALSPVVNNSETGYKFDILKTSKPNEKIPTEKILETISQPDPLNGSNNFAVSSQKSYSGNVLLANEPDLGLNSPSIWYVSHLNCPTVNTMGALFPGQPGVIIGFNDSIAWGFTNSPRDVLDYYLIEFSNSTREEYKYNEKWLKTQTILEEIKIRVEKTFIDTVIYTHYGPVVYDRNFKASNQRTNFAMRWVAHEQTNFFRIFYTLNKAKNYNDFLESLYYFDSPAQNVIYGDVFGNIAIWVEGKFPLKWKEQGKFLMDGTDSKYEWTQFIPQEQNAYEFNPKKGFVSSANQYPIDTLYPYYVYDDEYEYYRNRRINYVLGTSSKVTIQDMMNLQNDNFNLKASENISFMLNGLDTIFMDKKMDKIYTALKKWNYEYQHNKPEAAYFEVWWNKMYEQLWDEFDTMKVAIYKPSTFHTAHILKNYPTNSFINIVSTPHVETLSDLLKTSFYTMVDSLNKWEKAHPDKLLTWGNFKNTTVTHLMRLKPFSREGIMIGGNGNTVNAASHSHGPSWRMVVELDKKGVKAYGVYPGSQTGNPGNISYNSMIDDWAKGNYYPLLFSNDEKHIQNKSLFIQTLNPIK